MRLIEDIIDDVIRREKGYVNDPRDRGGATNWGITEAVARANGYHGDMRDLPRATAVDIYRRQYADAPGFTAIARISRGIASELVDTGVNMGPQTAARFLQRALNALNREQADYRDLVVDGDAGPATRAALESLMRKRGRDGERAMLAALNALQGERYIALAEARPKNEAFVFGWLLNRVADA